MYKNIVHLKFESTERRNKNHNVIKSLVKFKKKKKIYVSDVPTLGFA